MLDLGHKDSYFFVLYPARLSPDLQPGAYRVLFQQTPHPFLKEVIEVAGRQGVACDGEYYYVSGSTALFGKLSPDEQQAALCRIGELMDNEKDYSSAGKSIGAAVSCLSAEILVSS